MAYALMLIVGLGEDSPDKAEGTAHWHQANGLWLSNRDFHVQTGTPVVARMAGPSNELLIDGIVSGDWRPSSFADWQWSHEIPITWSRHIVRDVRAHDVLGDKGTARPSCITLTRAEWAAVQRARL